MATGAEAAGIGLMVAGTAASTAATIKASQNQQAQAEANAKAAEMEGRQAEEVAAARAEARTREGRRIIARQRVLMAEGAASPGTGTLAELQAETAEQVRMDALAEMYGGRQARAGLDYEAKALKSQGRATRTAGYIEAGAGLLKGASSAYGSYSRMGDKP